MPRTRLAPLAVLLALLLPGLGGSWLSLGHPCPAAEALAASGNDAGGASAEHAGHHGPESPAPDAPGHHDGHCDCLGACQGGAVPLAPRGLALATAQHTYARVTPAAGWTTWFPLHTPLDLLPLPTAPPVA